MPRIEASRARMPASSAATFDASPPADHDVNSGAIFAGDEVLVRVPPTRTQGAPAWSQRPRAGVSTSAQGLARAHSGECEEDWR